MDGEDRHIEVQARQLSRCVHFQQIQQYCIADMMQCSLERNHSTGGYPLRKRTCLRYVNPETSLPPSIDIPLDREGTATPGVAP